MAQRREIYKHSTSNSGIVWTGGNREMATTMMAEAMAAVLAQFNGLQIKSPLSA